MWIFEGTNDVELHFGPTEVNNPVAFFEFTGPLIGFMDTYSFPDDEFDNLWYLVGTVDNPVVHLLIDIEGFDTMHHTLDGAPGDGQAHKKGVTPQWDDALYFSTNKIAYSEMCLKPVTVSSLSRLFRY